jgi:hypothetical protein
VKWPVLVIALAACGDQDVLPPDCPVTFAGNFGESLQSCPEVAGGGIAWSVDSRTLGGFVMVSLPAASAGVSTSDSVASEWSAVGAASIGNGTCSYIAGAEATPRGSYVLDLAQLDPPRGTLDVLMHVQATIGTDCGPDTQETIHAEF